MVSIMCKAIISIFVIQLVLLNCVQFSRAYTLEECSVLYKNKQYLESAQCYSEIASLLRDDKAAKDAIFGRALSYLRNGEFSKGKFDLVGLNNNGYEHPALNFWLGYAEHRLCNYEDAIAYYTKSIICNDGYRVALKYRGMAFFDLAVNTKYTTYSTNFVPFPYVVYEIDDPKRQADASIILNRSEKDFDMYYSGEGIENDELCFDYGVLKYLVSEHLESIDIFESCRCGDIDMYRKYYFIGLNQYELNLYNDSITSFNKSISLNQNYHQSYYRRAMSKIKLGQYDDAKKDLAKAYSIDKRREYLELGSRLFKLMK